MESAGSLCWICRIMISGAGNWPYWLLARFKIQLPERLGAAAKGTARRNVRTACLSIPEHIREVFAWPSGESLRIGRTNHASLPGTRFALFLFGPSETAVLGLGHGGQAGA